MSKEIQKMILEGIMNRLNEGSDLFDNSQDLSASELAKVKGADPTYIVAERESVNEEDKHGDVHLLHVFKPFGEKETHIYFPHLECLEKKGPSGNNFAIKIMGRHLSPSDVKKAFPDNY